MIKEETYLIILHINKENYAIMIRNSNSGDKGNTIIERITFYSLILSYNMIFFWAIYYFVDYFALLFAFLLKKDEICVAFKQNFTNTFKQ